MIEGADKVIAAGKKSKVTTKIKTPKGKGKKMNQNVKTAITVGITVAVIAVVSFIALTAYNKGVKTGEQNQVKLQATIQEAVAKVKIVSNTAEQVLPEVKALPVIQPTGCEQYRTEIAKYDWDVETMMAIVEAESSCNPNATGDKSLTYQQNGRTYGYSNGLLQVRILPGREACDTHDPAANILCGYNVYKSQGYRAWSVYISGEYLKFL